MAELREEPGLVRLIRNRDPRTLETVARENFDLLLRGARAASLSVEDAHDVVQETLLVFVRRADAFDGRASVRTWLYGILLRKISEHRRSAARDARSDDLDSVFEERFDEGGNWVRPPQRPDAYASASQAMSWIRECVERLPERRRLAFSLREMEQMEMSEICNILSVSLNNLGVLLFRARNSVRECMEAKGIRGADDVAL